MAAVAGPMNRFVLPWLVVRKSWRAHVLLAGFAGSFTLDRLQAYILDRKRALSQARRRPTPHRSCVRSMRAQRRSAIGCCWHCTNPRNYLCAYCVPVLSSGRAAPPLIVALGSSTTTNIASVGTVG